MLVLSMLVDVHTHFDLYNNNMEKALTDIKKNQILSIWNCIDPGDYSIIKEHMKDNSYLIPAFGIHPTKAHEYANNLEDYTPTIKESLFFGEIGLDYQFVKNSDYYPLQKTVFEFFCSAAQKYNTPIIVHLRAAYEQCLEILDTFNIKTVILHNFDGPLKFFSKFIEKDCYFSVSSTILDEYQDKIPDWDNLQYIATNIPTDLLLLETDGPGLQKEMLPSHKLELITLKVSDLRNSSFDEIEKITNNNFLNIIQQDEKFSNFIKLL